MNSLSFKSFVLGGTSHCSHHLEMLGHVTHGVLGSSCALHYGIALTKELRILI